MFSKFSDQHPCHFDMGISSESVYYTVQKDASMKRSVFKYEGASDEIEGLSD